MVPLIFTILPPTLGLFYFLFRGSMHSGKEEEFLDIFTVSLARYCYAFNGPSITLLGRRSREQNFFGPYVVAAAAAAVAAAVIAAAFSSPATCLLIMLLLLLLLFEMEVQSPPIFFTYLFKFISFLFEQNVSHFYQIPIPLPPPRTPPACPISSASPPAAPPYPRAQQKGSRWPRGA